MEKAALAGYPQIARMVYERPWAILPSTLGVIEEVVRLRMDGQRFTEDEIAERLAAADAAAAPRQMAPPGTPGALAVIPLMGVLLPRANMMSALSGGTSLQSFQARFRDALDSPDVAGIMIEVDSPGGSVDLVPETADMVYAARDVKPVVAFANTMAASAAYYIASQADEFYMTRSGEVGSIGVRMAHRDVSGALTQAGINMTEIAAPEFKTEGTPYQPLSDETIAYLQGEVDAVYGEFVQAVARGRNANPETVREDMGRGRMLRADDALAAGMVDGVATFDQAVVRLAQMTRGARGRLAVAEFVSAIAYGKPLPIESMLDADDLAVMAMDNEIPEPQVAATGDDGGKPAARARLRGRRIDH